LKLGSLAVLVVRFSLNKTLLKTLEKNHPKCCGINSPSIGGKMNIESIHKKALEIARHFHKAESDLISVLQEIDRKKIFIHVGFNSLFDYATKALKLSEANASAFIAISRKSESVPALKAAIESGNLTVSKARRLTSVISKENSSYWIELACTLKRAQDLVSQKSKKAASYEETLSALLEFFLKRQDPLEKAKRNIKKGDTNADDNIGADANIFTDNAFASGPGHVKSGSLDIKDEPKESLQARKVSHSIKPKKAFNPSRARKSLDAQTLHRLHIRDGCQCSFQSESGVRCMQRRWLHIHHKNPLSHGGSNEFENLQTLCQNHHKLMHLT
jgi:hypothetical protein